MLEHNRTIPLTYPSLLAFLHLKWRNYGRLAVLVRKSLLVVIIVLLTTLTATSDPPRPSFMQSSSNTYATNDSDIEVGKDLTDSKEPCFIYCHLTAAKESMLLWLSLY